MPLILPVEDKHPQIGDNCFIAENATIVGDVIIGKNCSIWFTAVVRGDVNSIQIGDRTNIQDGAVIHCTYKKAGTSIGNDVSIGHRAIVHGCSIKDRALVGMGAIVMDDAVVEEDCIIAAGAVVLEKTICEAGHIYAGIPAKKIKKLSEAQIENLKKTAANYIMYSKWFREE
ncbi:gamma carbonic anhydrase family protein [Salinimicrobium sp. TH3]|uniref:gamma carbonic anhydrase family protein n=1 Tax=Salinimicrobium sp. TH3 TaxID=2997342 RepID=UPI002276C398|nr:gamma carbonic anhydrase family protein [Salinimicrobium sp. TH3]MCY2685890.1 gamma carbonic anhydrase family protein [Salinimicrobium sp. TH3]